jgi:hypothetical protein
MKQVKELANQGQTTVDQLAALLWPFKCLPRRDNYSFG